jgi:hypothetical protein
MEIIIASIPWVHATYTNQVQAGDWINNRLSRSKAPMEWVYHVTHASSNFAQASEFQIISHNGLIRVTSSQEVNPKP